MKQVALQAGTEGPADCPLDLLWIVFVGRECFGVAGHVLAEAPGLGYLGLGTWAQVLELTGSNPGIQGIQRKGLGRCALGFSFSAASISN